MKKVYCDICNDFINDYERGELIPKPYYENYDLCKACESKIHKFIDELKNTVYIYPPK